jgi:hypothetical protein
MSHLKKKQIRICHLPQRSIEFFPRAAHLSFAALRRTMGVEGAVDGQGISRLGFVRNLKFAIWFEMGDCVFSQRDL